MGYIRQSDQRGVTLVELAMAIAVAGIILVGVMAFINYATQGLWFVKGGIELTSQASEALGLIAQDFKNAKASSMGNIAQNPGLEDPLQKASNPIGWEALSANVTRYGYSGSNLKSGVMSIKVAEGSVYRSNQFNIPANRNYIISGWIKYPGNLNLVNASDNSTLTPLIANTTPNWVHLSSSVVFGASKTAKLNLSLPIGSWIVCSTPAPGLDKDITEVVSYKNKIYVGGWENGATMRYTEFTGEHLGSISYGINPHVTALGVFDPDGFGPRGEELIFCAGFWDWGNAASWHQWQVYYNQGANWLIGWPIAGEYPQWNGPAPGPDSGWGTGRHFFRCGAAYKSKLYVGTGGATALAGGPFYGDFRVYDPAGAPGAKWTTLFTTSDLMVSSLCVYNDRVYIGTALSSGSWHLPSGGGNIYVYDIVNNTMVAAGAVQQNTSGFARNMVTYTTGVVENLYIAAGYLYKFDGTTWSNIQTLGVVSAVCVYNNKLYVGNTAGSIYSSTDGVTFVSEIGIGQSIRRFCVNDDLLYAGCSNNGWGNPRLLAWVNRAYFDDISISPEQVVFDGSTVVNGVDNIYTYSTSKGISETEYQRFKLYRLRFNTPTRTLFREVSNDGGTTWSLAGLALNGNGAICDKVKRLSITNHNQESFEIELTLEIDIKAGKKKEYLLRSTVTPAIS